MNFVVIILKFWGWEREKASLHSFSSQMPRWPKPKAKSKPEMEIQSTSPILYGRILITFAIIASYQSLSARNGKQRPKLGIKQMCSDVESRHLTDVLKLSLETCLKVHQMVVFNFLCALAKSVCIMSCKCRLNQVGL